VEAEATDAIVLEVGNGGLFFLHKHHLSQRNAALDVGLVQFAGREADVAPLAGMAGEEKLAISGDVEIEAAIPA
jgi:hypothetical protein